MLQLDEISKRYKVRFIVDTNQDKKEMMYCSINSTLLENAENIVSQISNVFMDHTYITFKEWRESFCFSDRLTSHAISIYFMNSCSNKKIYHLKEILARNSFYKLIIVLCTSSDICMSLMNNGVPVTYILKQHQLLSELKIGVLTAVAQLNQLTGAYNSNVIAYQSDKAKGNGCTLECRIDKSNQVVRSSLKQILENSKLSQTTLIQVNKSTLINTDYILNIEPAFSEVQMICAYNEEGETVFPISRKYRKQIKDVYQSKFGESELSNWYVNE